MILLALIAFGFLSFSAVTLRSSTNEAALREAQANARLAMNMALGELQRLAGADQCATATANLAGDDNGDALGAGVAPSNNSSLDGTSKGLTAVQPGTRYWTVVFSNNDEPEDYACLLYTSPSPRDQRGYRMPSSA